MPGELLDAARWYEERRQGLGRSFLDEVEQAFQRIDERPELYQVVHLDIRRAPIRRFPYSVYYLLDRDSIQILAVAHDARHPSLWRRRR